MEGVFVFLSFAILHRMITSPAVRNLLLTIAVLVLLGGGIYMYFHRASNNSSTPLTASTTTQTLPDGTVITGLPPGATVTEVSEEQSTAPKAPDYTKPIIFSPSLDANLSATIRVQFEEVKSMLAKKPTDFDAWIRLGTLHKLAGDYQGAAVYWEYVSKLYPKNVVTFSNLGDLYMNFLKEYPKAELNYKTVIKLKPDYIDSYRNLYSLYRYLYKTNTSAAADILTEGLTNNPNNAELLQLQAELKAAH